MATPGGTGLIPNSPLLTEEIIGSTTGTLGNAATRNVGTTSGTVAAGDDSRFGASAGTGRSLYAASRWYLVGNAARVTNATPNEAWELAQRFVAAKARTSLTVAVKVVTAGTTGAVIRIGLKSEDANGLPGAVIAQGTTTSDATTTGIKTVTFTGLALVAGTGYYVSTAIQGAATTRPVMESVNGDGGDPDIGSDTSANAFSDWSVGYSTNAANVTGAMSTLTSWGTIGTVPRKMISAT